MGFKVLGIETSCDDTSAAVLVSGKLYSNVISSQEIHRKYGGVVPELASRAHQQNIILVIKEALNQSGFDFNSIDLIAFTKGPGLLGSLLVGGSFAKGLALASGKPMIGVNHLHGHLLAHFLRERDEEEFQPKYPFLCLLVSGGHTQIVIVYSSLKYEIIGQTIDDAAGEAFDKCAKIMGLGYPGGPVIDRLAKLGNPSAFKFSKPNIPDFNYSFSGLKTSFLYTLKDELSKDPNFIQNNINDLCASLQKTIIDILADKLIKAVKYTGITEIAISGGVSANSGLRTTLMEIAQKRGWTLHLPKLKYTTDNAAMIALVGYLRYLDGQVDDLNVCSESRLTF